MARGDPSAASSLFDLDPDEPLQRLPDLDVRLQSNGSVRVDLESRAILCGPHALRVLETFAHPTTFKDAIDVLKTEVRGTQDWVDLSDTIMNLFRAGVLEPHERASRRPAMRTGFDSPVEHISMLNDRARTGSYLDAIQEVVRPGDVVVELGTGTGVLAVAAARAGARHVYAIEAGSIGRVAEAGFAANGLSDRITLVPGLSTSVSLPERADVLISEIIGNEPLQERVLESTRDAIQRFLEPDARFLPRTLRIYAVPVDIPETATARFQFCASTQAQWEEWYGMDFRALSGGNAPDPFKVFVRPHRPRDWPRLSEPALLAEIDFSTGQPPTIVREATVMAGREGRINGIVEYFELGLSPGVDLSVDPAVVDEQCSWRLPVWFLPDPLEVAPEEPLTLRYEYGTNNRFGRVTIRKGTP
jgi:hypothetical protein